MAGKLTETRYGIVVQVPEILPEGIRSLAALTDGFEAGYGRVEDVTGFIADRAAADRHGLGNIALWAGHSGQPTIYDHNPDGPLDTRQPVWVRRFGMDMKKSGVDAVVLHPGVNANTGPYMESLLEAGVGVIAAADVSAATRRLPAEDAWAHFFEQAVSLGRRAVCDFQVPGDDPGLVKGWSNMFGNELGPDHYTLYSAPARRGDLDLTLGAVPNLQVIVPPGLDGFGLAENPMLPLRFGYAQDALGEAALAALRER